MRLLKTRQSVDWRPVLAGGSYKTFIMNSFINEWEKIPYVTVQ